MNVRKEFLASVQTGVGTSDGDGLVEASLREGGREEERESGAALLLSRLVAILCVAPPAFLPSLPSSLPPPLPRTSRCGWRLGTCSLAGSRTRT